MYFYCLKVVKNYKDVFKLMRIIEIKRFNSRLYFYCINNRINPVTIAVDLNKVPHIVEEGQLCKAA